MYVRCMYVCVYVCVWDGWIITYVGQIIRSRCFPVLFLYKIIVEPRFYTPDYRIIQTKIQERPNAIEMPSCELDA